MAPEARREELLDVAVRLCATVGYDAFSVDTLTREASVAKGTFYYYFGSKQDLLFALVERFVDALFTELERIAVGPEGSGAERFRLLLLGAASWKIGHVDDAYGFVPLLYKPENAELRHHLFDQWGERCREIFLPCVARGAEDGSLAVDDPEVTTDLVLSIWIDGAGRMYDRALAAPTEDAYVDIIVRNIAALSTAVERVLGASAGSFTVTLDPAFVRASRVAFLAALNGSPDHQPRS